MPHGVACSVNNCSYWGEGNRCAAQEIAIEIDAHATRGTGGEEFADELFGGHTDQAKQSAETCCLTFRPKS